MHIEQRTTVDMSVVDAPLKFAYNGQRTMSTYHSIALLRFEEFFTCFVSSMSSAFHQPISGDWNVAPESLGTAEPVYKPAAWPIHRQARVSVVQMTALTKV